MSVVGCNCGALAVVSRWGGRKAEMVEWWNGGMVEWSGLNESNKEDTHF
jgi:hypothetical protein